VLKHVAPYFGTVPAQASNLSDEPYAPEELIAAFVGFGGRMEFMARSFAMIDLVCGIFARGGQVLLVRRAPHKDWYPDRWDVPGGHVEKGESLDGALIRECVEEVGLSPTRYASLAQLPEPEETKHKKARYHVYLITEWEGGEPELLGDEHTEMRWIAPNEAAALPDLSHPQYASVFRALVARQPLAGP